MFVSRRSLDPVGGARCILDEIALPTKRTLHDELSFRTVLNVTFALQRSEVVNHPLFWTAVRSGMALFFDTVEPAHVFEPLEIVTFIRENMASTEYEDVNAYRVGRVYGWLYTLLAVGNLPAYTLISNEPFTRVRRSSRKVQK